MKKRLLTYFAQKLSDWSAYLSGLVSKPKPRFMLVISEIKEDAHGNLNPKVILRESSDCVTILLGIAYVHTWPPKDASHRRIKISIFASEQGVTSLIFFDHAEHNAPKVWKLPLARAN